VNREGQDTLLLFVGVMVLQVGLTDLHLRYVKPQMQPLLVAAGAVLTALAVVSIVRTLRGRSRRPTVVTASPTEHVPGGALTVSHGAGPLHPAAGRVANGQDGEQDDHGGQEHAHMPATAWLLALPLLVLTVITPPALGAYAAARGTSTIDAPSGDVLPLPAAVDGAVELSLTEFATRSLYAPDSVQGVPVRLTGFVLPGQDGWSVARIALSCCAADGRPVRVEVVGAPAPAADSWVTVQGRLTRLEGEGSRRVPVLAVDSVRPVDAPVQQYE
jgi:uncharacterized repeat protein (TIGR03943 family)